MEPNLEYRKVKDLDTSASQKYEIGELYDNDFLRARGIFRKKTKKMHGLVTFFKTIEIKLQKTTKEIIVVEQEGKFNNGQRKGLFRKYFYENLLKYENLLQDDQFSNFIQEFFEILTSPINGKTLRSKFFIEQYFASDTEVSGIFKQFSYFSSSKTSELIQARKLHGHIHGTYSVFHNRRLTERGDSSNLSQTPSQPSLQDPTWALQKTSTDHSTPLTLPILIIRRNFTPLQEGSLLYINRPKNFCSIILKGQPLLRRSSIGQPNEETIHYSYGNRVSFLGIAKGHFAHNNPNLWVLTEGQGVTFDRNGNSIYTGNFVKKMGGDVILMNGCYKSFDGKALVKSVRYDGGKVQGFGRVYWGNGKLRLIQNENLSSLGMSSILGGGGEGERGFISSFGVEGGFEYFGGLKNGKFDGYGIGWKGGVLKRRGVYVENCIDDKCAF
jgi:hypothetical protein